MSDPNATNSIVIKPQWFCRVWVDKAPERNAKARLVGPQDIREFNSAKASGKAIPDGFLLLFCTISTNSSEPIVGKKIELYYRKEASNDWLKAKLTANAFSNGQLPSLEIYPGKIIPNPVQHNIVTKRLIINRQRDLRGYLISPLLNPLMDIGILRSQSQQNKLKGFIKLVLYSQLGTVFETTESVDEVPAFLNI